MPPKKQTKQPADGPHASTAASATAATPTAVTVVPAPPPTTAHMSERSGERSCESPSGRSSGSWDGYVSPLKKLKKTMSDHGRKVIDSIDGLRDFISTNDTTKPEVRSSIRIQARLLWVTAETIKGLHFLRLFLGEHQAPESLEQQQQEYQAAQRVDPIEANQFLITLSLYEVARDDPSLPPLGAVISFTPTKLRLYRNCCQTEAKLLNIVTVDTS